MRLETLPEKIMKENDLKKYVEKAIEKVRKSLRNREKKKFEPDDKSDEPKNESPPSLMKKPRNWQKNTIKPVSTLLATMFFHVILTTECNLQCKYCFGESLDDFDEDFGDDIEVDYDLPRKNQL